MKKVYHKLVRDKIPEIIRADGGVPTTRILDDAEYGTALCKKLVEEAQEAVQAGDNRAELVKELGDILEVVEALAKQYNIDRAEIAQLQEKRRQLRGGFEKKIFLEHVEE